MDLILPWATQMQDSLGFKTFPHEALQAHFLWVVSSELAEPHFAFRKAAIIFLGSECCCHTSTGEACCVLGLWLPCLGLYGHGLPPHLLQVLPIAVRVFVLLLFHFPNGMVPKEARQGKNLRFPAYVRSNNLNMYAGRLKNMCGACRTTWINATVLQWRDLHLAHVHPYMQDTQHRGLGSKLCAHVGASCVDGTAHLVFSRNRDIGITDPRLQLASPSAEHGAGDIHSQPVFRGHVSFADSLSWMGTASRRGTCPFPSSLLVCRKFLRLHIQEDTGEISGKGLLHIENSHPTQEVPEQGRNYHFCLCFWSTEWRLLYFNSCGSRVEPLLVYLRIFISMHVFVHFCVWHTIAQKWFLPRPSNEHF